MSKTRALFFAACLSPFAWTAYGENAPPIRFIQHDADAEIMAFKTRIVEEHDLDEYEEWSFTTVSAWPYVICHFTSIQHEAHSSYVCRQIKPDIEQTFVLYFWGTSRKDAQFYTEVEKQVEIWESELPNLLQTHNLPDEVVRY